MTVLGITGGIGSGKSIVSQVLRHLGIAVYDCDSRAKELYDEDQELRGAMTLLCGERLYETESKRLDRAYLASLIFGDKDLLSRVNALVHPAVRRDIDSWKERKRAEGHRLVALESAILLQSEGLRERVDSVAVVCAPEELRLARAINRDHATEGAIRQRMAAQLSEKELVAQADFVLHNDETHALLPQIEQMLTHLSTKG